jgi:choline dehydrogenase-like flavoprotein
VLLSAHGIADSSVLDCDLCIVGTGAAGLTLVREFAHSRTQIIVLESGDFNLDPDTQGLYECETVNPRTPPLTESRLRFFGGTTNHWTGTSRPLDALDFAPRAHVANSGWPFTLEHLRPYYRRAAEVMHIGPSFSGDTPEPNTPLEVGSSWIETRHFFHINPLRFAEVYRQDCTEPENVRIILNANVLSIGANASATEAEHVEVATLDGRRFRVRSRVVVLATGGLENARILLNSDGVEPNGLGNRHDNVGRYFQDHPNITDTSRVAFSSFSRAIFYYLHRTNELEIGHHGFFWPTPAAQDRWKMLNCALWLMPIEVQRPSEGIGALRELGRQLGDGRIPDDVTGHLLRAIMDIDGIFASAYRKVSGSGPLVYTSWFWSECPPDRESRVTLTDDRDALGQRRLRVDWRIPEQYVHTYRTMHDLLAHELGKAGVARMNIRHMDPDDDPRDHVASSCHHMGTTRMHVDPRQGVVDADCRVHGIANLYVAGSSVFPTYGQTAATYTIVALALRLADHLKKEWA